MVQGLGFLSKKSWHTKNLSNQEKVWIAEQKKLAEEQKTKELAKQIQQEREREELDKIAGKKSSTLDRGIDWMYQHTAGASELAKEDEAKKQEEFLLGKEFVPDGAAAGDFDDGDQTQGIHNVMAQQHQQEQQEQDDQQDQQPSAEGHYGPSVKDRNESFRMRMEDPMFAVSRQRHDILQKHEHTKELYDKVGGPVTLMRKSEEEEENRAKRKDRKRRHRDDDDDDNRYRKKSDRKKHKKKSRRRRRRSRSRSSSPGSDSGRSDDYRRGRYDNGRRHRDNHDNDRRKDESRRSRSRSRDRERGHRRDYDDDYGHYRDRRSSHRQRDRYDDSSPDRRYGRGGRDYDRRRSYRSDDEDDNYDRKQRRSSDYSSKERPTSSNAGQAAEASTRRLPDDSKYGLQGGRKKHLHSSDLGPNQDLLRQKRQQKEAERQRIKELSSTRRRRTGDERARVIQEMQQDAVRKEERARMVSNNRNKHGHKEEEFSGRSASFITEMTKATHGIGDNSAPLSERLRQNRHTNQRSHESFL